jgi:hypothetical protein
MSSHLLQAASASCFPYPFRLREVSLEGILLHLSKRVYVFVPPLV